MCRGKCPDPPVERVGELVEGFRPATRERHDRKDIGERILHPVVKLPR